jgi:hypothetical protein
VVWQKSRKDVQRIDRIVVENAWFGYVELRTWRHGSVRTEEDQYMSVDPLAVRSGPLVDRPAKILL